MGRGSLFATLATLTAVSLLLSGCAAFRASESGTAIQEDRDAGLGQEGWWYARYRILWPENAEPNWSVDLYLADRVVSPVLEKHRGRIALWRFHRRAARDEAGHQFSFIFFSSARNARDVFNDLNSSRDLQAISDAGMVVGTGCDETSTVGKPRLEDTSDRSWSPAVQRAWPHFIMGVSEMWLRLIQEHRASMEKTAPPGSLPARLAIYQQVNAKITQSWRDEGRHALLHHLNALFGYEPLVVYERKLMGF